MLETIYFQIVQKVYYIYNYIIHYVSITNIIIIRCLLACLDESPVYK